MHSVVIRPNMVFILPDFPSGPECKMQKIFSVTGQFTIFLNHLLTLSTLGKIFSIQHFDFFFLFFPGNKI